ncbi:MAG: GNAT family N-acetyltransferase [Candidatus Promineifilaceae bacterium]
MAANFTIRTAIESDQPVIKDLIHEAGINPLGLHWSRFLVAANQEGTVVGCGQVKPHRDGSRELASLAVARDWRRRGVAGEIIRALQQKHEAPLWLTCMDQLVSFYQPFGFVRIESAAEMPAYFRRIFRLFKLFQAVTRVKGQLALMVWHSKRGNNL